MRELNSLEISQVQGAEGGKYWYSNLVENVVEMGMAGALIRVAATSVNAAKGTVGIKNLLSKNSLLLGVEGFAIGAIFGLLATGIEQVNKSLDLY